MARAFVPHVISRDSALGGYLDIERSLRVDQGTSNVSDGSFYSRTFANGNKRTFTISVWFKKCYTVGNIGDDSYTIISCGGGGSGSYAGRFGFDVYSSDKLQFVINNPAPTSHARARSTRRFRDNAWYHAVFAYDSTQATESDRMKMYINGELETMDSPSYPSQNYEGYFNNNVLHRVGSTSSWSSGADLGQFNGYLAEFNFIDGAALDASYFGFTEQQTGVWRPKKFKKSSIPNSTSTTYSNTFTASGNGFGSQPTTNAFNGNLSNGFNNNAGGQIITWNTSTYNLSGNVRMYAKSSSGLYDIYVNGNGTKVADTGSSYAWIDCGTHDVINEIQWAGTTYNTNTGLGSAGIYVAAIIVDGVWLRDTFSEFGTNGFHLDFKDNTNTTTIGYDKSGNANNFSPHDVQVSDSVPDTPTNDFCMMSGLNKNSGLSHGNLQFYKWNDSGAALVCCQASMDIPNTGKWVWEHRWTGYSHTRYWAMTRRLRAQGTYLDSSAYVYYDMYNGQTKSALNGSVVTTLTGGQTSYGDNTTRFWMMACDMDEMIARFYYNNTLISTIDIPELPDDGKGNYVWTWTSTNGGSGSSYDDRFNFGQDASYFGAASPPDKKDASGLGQFYTTVPAGHNCLCTKNLPARADVIVEPKKHFDTVLYTGNGSNNGDVQRISSLQFDPDFVWIKSNGSTHNQVFDTIRSAGGDKALSTNQTIAEYSFSDFDFLSNGFNAPYSSSSSYSCNTNSSTYAAWCWKAGGAAVSNSDGTITSSVSANTEAGFSIVSYTGNETNNATVGHGLGKSPDMVIIKDRDSNTAGNNWYVFHSALASGHYVKLNQTSATTAVSGTSNGGVGSVTSTTFNFVQGTSGNNKNVNESGDTFIAYCFTSIPGYSKFGQYTGNGSSDGTFVFTGFKPSFVLAKRIDSSGYWRLLDSKRDPDNPAHHVLFPNTNDGVSDTDGSDQYNTDFLSNGFKLRTTLGSSNAAGGTWIFMAFADQTSLNQYNLSVNAR